MTMARPEAPYALVFHFEESTTTVAPADTKGIPFDPAATVVRVTPDPLTVPCIVEYLDSVDQPTPFGTVKPSKVKVTLFDEEYELVKNASHVVIDGDRYLRHNEPPAFALFDATMHVMIFTAENET